MATSKKARYSMMPLEDALHIDLVTVTYLKKRLLDYKKTLKQPDDIIMKALGCTIPPSTRTDGRACLKIRSNGLQWKPRPWHIQRLVTAFEAGLDVRSLPKLDGSHMCGMGSKGCANVEHINYEPHSVNLDRDLCHLYHRCRCGCGVTQPFRVCPGHGNKPKCLQVEITE